MVKAGQFVCCLALNETLPVLIVLFLLIANLSNILLLLRLKSQLNKNLLQLLIAVIDNELLKTVPLQKK